MFEFNGAKISARVMTIGDEEDSYAILDYFPEGKRTVRVLNFVQFVLTADVAGEFSVPTLDATAQPDDYHKAYAAWRKLPRTFPELWEKEMAAAEGSPKK